MDFELKRSFSFWFFVLFVPHSCFSPIFTQMISAADSVCLPRVMERISQSPIDLRRRVCYCDDKMIFFLCLHFSERVSPFSALWKTESQRLGPRSRPHDRETRTASQEVPIRIVLLHEAFVHPICKKNIMPFVSPQHFGCCGSGLFIRSIGMCDFGLSEPSVRGSGSLVISSRFCSLEAEPTRVATLRISEDENDGSCTLGREWERGGGIIFSLVSGRVCEPYFSME
jgi:hypothetical protein